MCMRSEPQDLKALSPAELAELAAQMLAHITEQSKHIDAQSKRIDSQAQAIKWRDAKIESITFQLARLKAWKFGAKSERMNAEQREIFEETLAADQADLEAQLAALQAQLHRKPQRTRQAATPPAQARSTAATLAARGPAHRARGHPLPDARVRPAHGARGRGHQRAAGHRAGAVLRATPDPRQVGLQVLPAAGAGAGSRAGLRQCAANAGPAGPHGGQPLRRSHSLLPARADQRALGGAHAALDAGGLERAHRGADDAAVRGAPGLRARLARPSRRRDADLAAGPRQGARPRRPTCGPTREAPSIPSPAWCTTSAPGAGAIPHEFLAGWSGTLVCDEYAGYDRVLAIAGRVAGNVLPSISRTVLSGA